MVNSSDPTGATDTTCAIVGGGPAGMMLGLLLARSGVGVTVLERHADFLRDFRGDTIHASTLELIDELGLMDEFEKLPHRKVETFNIVTDDGAAAMGDLRDLPIKYRYMAFVPQWDFLDLLADAARQFPNFRLLMEAEAVGLIRVGDQVTGVRYRRPDGSAHEVNALLTVAADGRNSVLRASARLTLKQLGAPMDVVWFRLPREDTDPDETFLRLGTGHLMVAINRTTYWQLAYLIPKGEFAELTAPELRKQVTALLPYLGDRVTAIATMDDVSMLEVRVDRLRKWHRPGLLFIGDAAHAMSPVAGVGINLAIQDAVAAANLLTEPLLRGAVTSSDLAAIQRRRLFPTVATQAVQRFIQARVIRRTLRGSAGTPTPFRLIQRIPPLRRVAGYFLGMGFRPEHIRKTG